ASTGPARPRPGKDDSTAANGGAPVRHDQDLDGLDALSDANTSESGDRNGAQRARLQYEAGDGDHGRQWIAESDGGLRGAHPQQNKRAREGRREAPDGAEPKSWRKKAPVTKQAKEA